jgi:hypothetical protein
MKKTTTGAAAAPCCSQAAQKKNQKNQKKPVLVIPEPPPKKMQFSRDELMKAMRVAWQDTRECRHGNPYIALERVLFELGLAADEIQLVDGRVSLKGL